MPLHTPAQILQLLLDATREQINHSIASVKKEETRLRRVKQVIELLTETMEAERDPPPMIKAALAHNTKARQGWKLMPQSLRRQYLISIFRSRFPETRARNLELTMRHCAQYADRRSPAHKPNVETGNDPV